MSQNHAGHRGVVPVLTVCIAVIGANSLALSPIAPSIAAAFLAPAPTVMLAGGGYGLGTAFGALFLARYIDRIGVKRSLVAAMALLGLAFAASAAAPNVWALVGAQAAAGLAAGIGLPAIYAFAAVIAPPGRESAVLGAVLTGWTLSMVAGVSLSAVLADLVGWRTVYGSLTGLALLAVLALALTRHRRQAPAATTAPSPLTALRVPDVARLLLVCIAYMTAFYGVYAYLGDHVYHALGQAVSASGLVALAYGLGFGAAVFADPLIDRIGARRMMPFAYAGITAVYLLLTAASGTYAAIVGIALIWGLMNHFGLNVLIGCLSAIDPARRGTILGLNSAVTYLSVTVGTVGFGPLYQLGGWPLLTLTAAALCAAAVLLTWTGPGRQSDRASRARAAASSMARASKAA